MVNQPNCRVDSKSQEVKRDFPKSKRCSGYHASFDTTCCCSFTCYCYLTSTTRVALSASNASSMVRTISLTRSTPTLTAVIISSAASGVPPAFDKTHNSRCGFSVKVKDPDDTTVSKCVGSRIGVKLRSVAINVNDLPFVICERYAERDMMYSQKYWRSFVRCVLLSAVTEKTRRTRITSSPITSTSGRLKCRRAVIAASDAQSSRFPESDRKCKVKRSCQTCE